MEMQKLLATLQELRSTELDSFKWYLQMADSFVGDLIPVTAAALEDATTREKIVTLIMAEYPNDAQEIVMNVLRKIKRNDLVKKFAITPKAPGQKPQPQVERPQSTQATDASGVQKPLIYQATADEKAEFVKKHKNDLIQRVEQVLPIAGDLRDKSILTWQNYGNLRSEKNSYDQMIMLFDDFILRKGTAAMSAFYDVLQTYEPFLVKDLGPVQSNRREEVKDDQYKLTSKTTGLSATRNNEISEKPEYNRPGTSKEADGPVQSKKTVEIEVEDDHYKLTSKPGLCVIINNENFKDPKAKRHGSKKDAVNLAETFSWLGFRVLMCKDQTMSQMQVTLEHFSSLKDPTEKDLTELQKSKVKEWSMDEGEFTNLTVEDPPQHRDAFVCCIMSHGDKGAVFGTDGKPLLINDITTTFNGKACPVLLNKPKVFFIQACQGEGIQSGIAADSSPKHQEAPKIPVDADFLVFMATTENNKAFRSRIDGSWFIQSVCKQLGEGSQRGKDLLAILTAVNREMADKEVSLDEIDAKSTLGKELEKAGQKEIKQMSVGTKNTLRKLLVFSPISE